ncbi:MAG TPA: hypothetical protein PKK06_05520 [Phycisphaerae bacterium]|nr:hypothetical protein [Phycisphaerae bacterium]HNU44783.1 hypothetical protein [Phycisphaerae bacterium]
MSAKSENYDAPVRIVFGGRKSQTNEVSGNALGRSNEARLLRALLVRAHVHAHVHWMEGFLLFPTWRAKRQKKKTYPEQFGVFASKAAALLRTCLDLEDAPPHSIDVPSVHQTTWSLHTTVPLTSNLVEANTFLDAAKEAFCKSADAVSAWQLVDDAFNAVNDDPTVIDPAKLLDALQFVGDPRATGEATKEQRDRIEHVVSTYNTDLARAITKVTCLAHEELLGVNPRLAACFLEDWLKQIGQARECLDLLKRARGGAPSAAGPVVDAFVTAANEYREACRDLQQIPAGAPERVVLDHEAEQRLEVACTIEFAADVRRKVELHFEEQFHQGVREEDVAAHFRPALASFIMQYPYKLLPNRSLLPQVCAYVRQYLWRERHEAGELLRLYATPGEDARFTAQISATLDRVSNQAEAARSVMKILRQFRRSRPQVSPEGARKQLPGGLRQQQPGLSRPRGVRPLRDEMKTRSNEQLHWFRKSGPTAADFRDGRVYRPDEKINEMRDELRKSHVVRLTGERATGKTVLARWLAYDWRGEKFEDSYYLDCRLHRDFDVYKLATFIKQADQLFLLENMHLEPYKLQCLWGELKETDLDGYVVITARLIPHEDSRLEPLDKLPTVVLTPFAYADDIICAFAARAKNPHVFASQAIRSQLRTVGKDDYWLLTYALRGCDAAAGSGDPKTWVREGVCEDLGDLRSDGPRFPRILLSLAPLYLGEVSTAEAFLTDELGFTDTELHKLVRRREITESKRYGQLFYGLPHASLAAAYWEHGQEFRRKPWSLEDFIYRYAAADTPNGLEAVASAPQSVFRRVDERLEEEGLVKSVLGRERSVTAILRWLRRRAAESRLRGPVLTCIADRLHAFEQLGTASECLSGVYGLERRAGDALLSAFAGPELTRKLNESATVDDVWLFLCSVHPAFLTCNKKVWRSVDVTSLAAKLNAHTTSDASRVCGCVAALYAVDVHTGEQLWEAIDASSLGEALSADPHVWHVCTVLRELRTAHEPAAVALARTLAFKQLIASIEALANTENVVFCAATLAGLAEQIQKPIAALFDTRKLASLIAGPGPIERMARWAADLFNASPSLGTAVWESLYTDLTRRADTLGDAKQICRCITILQQANPAAAAAFWSACPQGKAKAHIDRFEHVEEAIECVCTLYSVHRACGGDLRDLADPTRIAASLDTDDDITRVCRCLGSLFRAAEDTGEHVWSLMNRERFAERLNELPDLYAFHIRADALAQGGERLLKVTEPLWDGECLTRHVLDADDFAEAMQLLCETLMPCYGFSPQVIQRIDWARLAERRNHIDDPVVVAFALREANAVGEDEAAIIWNAIDKPALAARISQVDTACDLALVFGDFSWSQDMAQKLWSHIKEGKRLSELAERAARWEADLLVDVVRRWSKHDATELAYLLSSKADHRMNERSHVANEDQPGTPPDPTKPLPGS